MRCQHHFQRLLFNIHCGYHVFIQQVRRHRKKLAKNTELEFTLDFQKTFVNDVVAHFFVNDVVALVSYLLPVACYLLPVACYLMTND